MVEQKKRKPLPGRSAEDMSRRAAEDSESFVKANALVLGKTSAGKGKK